MTSLKQKFARLLSLELESLHDERELIVENMDHRLERHEITDYVRNENYAILKNEIIGLERFLVGVEIPLDTDVDSIDEIAMKARAYIRERLAERGYVAALSELVNLRIDKICAYLKLDRSPHSAERST